VAVLDVKRVGEEEAEEKGVVYYECDVGDARQVEDAVKKIVKDVRLLVVFGWSELANSAVVARRPYDSYKQCWHCPSEIDHRDYCGRSRTVRPHSALYTYTTNLD
jgi:hypothetical protein